MTYETTGFRYRRSSASFSPRFSPSTEAVEVINSLQTTTWKVDKYEARSNQPNDTYSVVKEVLEHEINSNILQHLTIGRENGDFVLRLKISNRALARFETGRFGSGWTLRFIDQLHEEFLASLTSGAWQFDWRGRRTLTTPMLSPQNDSGASLLRFAKPVRLDGGV